MWKEIGIFFIGFFSNYLLQFFQKRKRIRNHLGAISVEADIAKDYAHQLTADIVVSPSYRLPVLSYESTFSLILSEGALTADEIKTIMEFYSLVDSINRGLDLIASIPHTENVIKIEDHPMLSAYHSRNFVKAKELIDMHGNVRKILNEKIKLFDKSKLYLRARLGRIQDR